MDSHSRPQQQAGTELISRGAEWLGLVAGIWLIIAPFGFAMDFSGNSTALWSTLAVGAVAIVGCGLSIMRLASAATCYALLGLAGVWAVVAPYALDFAGGSGGDPALNSIITGIVMAVLALAGYSSRTTLEQ